MIKLPYLLFLGDVQSAQFAKTAFGVRDWRPDACAAEWRMPKCKVSLGLPLMTPAHAVAAGAKSLLIGVAPVGGQIQEHWVPSIVEAIEAGLDIVSGMHTRLETVEPIRAAAKMHPMWPARRAPRAP